MDSGSKNALKCNKRQFDGDIGEMAVYAKDMGGIIPHTLEKRFWFSNISKLKNFQNIYRVQKILFFLSITIRTTSSKIPSAFYNCFPSMFLLTLPPNFLITSISNILGFKVTIFSWMLF